jgi:AcrR family transcriptional regulator
MTTRKPRVAKDVARDEAPPAPQAAAKPVKASRGGRPVHAGEAASKTSRRRAAGDAQPSAPDRQKRAYLPAEERRRQIIAAVQDVFAESTLQGATTRNLAKAADVNVATIFALFGSKEELFMASVVEPLLEIMRDMHNTHVVEDAGTAGELREVILPSMERNLRTMIDIFPLLASALFSDPKIGRQFYVERIQPLIHARSEGIAPFLKDDVDPDLKCLAGFGIEFAIAMDRFFRDGGDDVSDIALQVRDMVFSDLRTTPKRPVRRKR